MFGRKRFRSNTSPSQPKKKRLLNNGSIFAHTNTTKELVDTLFDTVPRGLASLDTYKSDFMDQFLTLNPHQNVDPLLTTARRVFGITDWRPGQKDAIDAAIQGRDLLMIHATGFGKSLCFQLPGIQSKKVTLVVSPLLSLIEDQVFSLRKKGIRAEYLSSHLDKMTMTMTMSELWNYDGTAHGKPTNPIQFLYFTPERLHGHEQDDCIFRDLLAHLYNENRIERVVIDEAHCVSTLGHNFRPKFRGLSYFRFTFPMVPITCLTATATDLVKDDIIKTLGLWPIVERDDDDDDDDDITLPQKQTCHFSRGPFNRPNLHFSVVSSKGNMAPYLSNWVRTHYPLQPGIVYCLSRRDCETMSKRLRDLGIAARFYHAGLEAAEKRRRYTLWMQGKIHIICATIAFGMGIDKPDGRFVIHACMSKSLAAYVQESGRAGRDGKRADCLILYKPSDRSKLLCLQTDKSKDGSEEEVRKRQEENDKIKRRLYAMDAYCIQHTCRRLTMVSHFNQRFDVQNCAKTCDCCSGRVPMTKIRLLKFMKCVRECVASAGNFRRGITTIVKILCGSRAKDMKCFVHHSFHNCVERLFGATQKKYDLANYLLTLFIHRGILVERVKEGRGKRPPYVVIGNCVVEPRQEVVIRVPQKFLR